MCDCKFALKTRVCLKSNIDKRGIVLGGDSRILLITYDVLFDGDKKITVCSEKDLILEELCHGTKKD